MSGPSMRQDFAFFDAHPQAVYLDNASATLVPSVVSDAIKHHLDSCFMHLHHTSHSLARNNQTLIKNIVKAAETAFSIPSTYTLQIAPSVHDAMEHFASALRNTNTTVGVSPLDHTSTKQAWKTHNYTLTEHEHDTLTGALTTLAPSDIAVISHAHNTIGLVNPLKKLTDAQKNPTITIVDATQTAGHMPFSVAESNADIILMSGYKLFSIEGCALVITKRSLHDQLTSPNWRIPCSTLSSLAAALEYRLSLDMTTLAHHVHTLTHQLVQYISHLGSYSFGSGVGFNTATQNVGIVTFRHNSIPAQDIADYLDENNIHVRSGQHCVLHDDIPDTIRVSLHGYSTDSDITRLVDALKEIDMQYSST